MSVEMLCKSYADVCDAAPGDSFKAYAELYSLVETTEFDPAEFELLAPSKDRATVTSYASQLLVRLGKSSKEQEPYFRGTGAIVVATSTGRILTATYVDCPVRNGDADDPVADKYPGYQTVALRKAGLAAAVAHSGLARGNQSRQALYDGVEEQLQDVGIYSGSVGHHLGYMYHSWDGDSGLTIGSSGMLPSDATAASINSYFATRLANEQALLDGWDGNAFAGLHDATASHSIGLAFQRLMRHDYAEHYVQPLSPNDYPTANVH